MAKTIEEVRAGTFQGSWNELTFADGAMRLAEFNEAVSQETIALVEETQSCLQTMKMGV